jgi:hypothetical protein
MGVGHVSISLEFGADSCAPSENIKCSSNDTDGDPPPTRDGVELEAGAN